MKHGSQSIGNVLLSVTLPHLVLHKVLYAVTCYMWRPVVCGDKAFIHHNNLLQLALLATYDEFND